MADNAKAGPTYPGAAQSHSYDSPPGQRAIADRYFLFFDPLLEGTVISMNGSLKLRA
jgi:hypothetical protein